MKQLTIRGFEPELERHIREVARSERISLNQAVIRVLRKGAGIARGGDNPRAIGSALDDLIGTLSDREAREFDEAVKDFERVDGLSWICPPSA